MEIKVFKMTNTSNLALRFWADDLFNSLEKLHEKKLVLDFSGIEFMSRSFANEYLKLKKLSYKQITEKDMSENLKQMLKLAATTKVETREYQEIPRTVSSL